MTRALLLATLLTFALGCGGRALDRLVCDHGDCAFSSREWDRLNTLSPLLPPSADRSNAYRDLPAAVSLGRDFFSDARFAGPATQVDALGRPSAPARAFKGQPTGVSCATCHDLQRGGVDVTSAPGNVSAGAGWTDVNALPIVNSVYNRLWFRNGRADSGWALAVAVAESATTMNGNRLHTAWVITDHYRPRYEAIFGPLPLRADSSVPDPRFPLEGKPGTPAWDGMRPDDQTAIRRVLVNWAKAVDAYQSSLVSGETPFDVFVREGPSSNAISAAAKRGARLFVGRAGCIDCHAGPLLSDGDFHDIGVPQAGPMVPTESDCAPGEACLAWGAWDGLGKLHKNEYLRTSVWSDDQHDTSRAPEVGRLFTDALKGAWRTPSLRDVALTAPYMHDGLYATLSQVVAHYDRGGSPGAVGVSAPQIRPLGLTDREKTDMVAFLETLTGASHSTPDAGSDAGRDAGRDAGAPAPPRPIPDAASGGEPGGSGLLGSIVSMDAGSARTCAVRSDLTVSCWGRGPLGDGSSADQRFPVTVASVPGTHLVSVGGDTCLAGVDDTARCVANTTPYLSVAVAGLAPVHSVSAGDFVLSCAVMLDDTVWCWGSPRVAQVPLPGAVLTVAVGAYQACALLTDSTVWCWGAEPPKPIGLTGARALSLGADDHACAALTDGTVRCWGNNNHGQLGDGTLDGFGVPLGLQGISDVAAGGGHTCAVTNDGTVHCWGDNRSGQLGDGTTTSSARPVAVVGLSAPGSVSAITAGTDHTCALVSDGMARCWGGNSHGQLGNGTTAGSTVPLPVYVP